MATAVSPNSELSASILDDLALAYIEKENLNMAKSCAIKARDIRESKFGKESIEVSRSYLTIAQVLFA